jgi:hypothetical protein
MLVPTDAAVVLVSEDVRDIPEVCVKLIVRVSPGATEYDWLRRRQYCSRAIVAPSVPTLPHPTMTRPESAGMGLSSLASGNEPMSFGIVNKLCPIV